MKKILRKEARAQRLKRYYTGKPCKYGHRTERNTSTGQCLDCSKRKDRLRRGSTDPEFASLKSREKHLKTRYGINLAEYMRLVDVQDGRCAACGAVTTDLVVDHNHDTDKVRGLLCSLCNSVIGFAKDSPKILQLCIDYLLR